jgi:aerobic carbon-monoxide dehydrogenase small subunit
MAPLLFRIRPMPVIHLHVNGRAAAVPADNGTLLVDLLRSGLGLTGTHQGCDTAQCGCCTVLLDGDSVKACSVLAVQAEGRSVTTVEGLAGLHGGRDGSLHPVQEAFVACHGLQCGFCTPGMMMSATCLLQHTPRPSEAEIAHALEGNLCRCTGYVNIVAAVQQAAMAMAKTEAA